MNVTNCIEIMKNCVKEQYEYYLFLGSGYVGITLL